MIRKWLLGYYDYTVVLTYCGLMFAVTGIFMVFKGYFIGAAICLMFAGLCDMFDGMIASTKDRSKMEKCFGIQIDSLCDLISFGVLPGLFVFCLLDQRFHVGMFSALFILSALIRLAYFNVMEEERQKSTEERRTCYQGMPVTSIAVILPAGFILYYSNILPAGFIFPIILLITGICFLLPIEIRKPHKAGKVCLMALGAMEMISLFAMIGVGI